MPSSPLPEVYLRVLALLRLHGRQSTSFQILEPGLCYWFWGDSAVVAYAEVGSAWVTAGEPICSEDELPRVVKAFAAAAHGADKRLRFFHVGQDFAARTQLASTHIGEQPVWDPCAWEAVLTHARSLREQLRRARAKGVTTRLVPASEIVDPEGVVRKGCERLIARWLASRRMETLKFMVRVHPFDFVEERRFVLAEREGRVVGLGVAVPVYARAGWFIEDLLRDPEAPNGTAEVIVDALFRAFAAEGSRYATLGLAPLSGDVGRVLSFTRSSTNHLYNFSGVRAFKEKLRPARWEPVHLAFPRHESGVFALRDVLSAFAPSGFMRFALRTVVHQRRIATGLLAFLLVPWTLGLALVDGARWFPSVAVQRAWVGFDLLLIALMFSLVRHWRSRVAGTVVVLTTLDAWLTTLQALLWNVHTARGFWEACMVVVACTGPLLAATFFWATRLVSVPSLGKR